MDALALLCTLHGDGPATLKRLRRAGCASLEDVERRGPEELAELLEVTDSVARRFGREARHLVQRMEGQALDREETAEPGPVATAAGPSDLGRSDRAILSSVLDRWREQDARELVLTTAPVAAEVEPEPEAEVALAAIPAGTIDGLDGELSRALAAQGIGSLEELADADGLLLSDAIGTPFSTVRRFQFLAQRATLATQPEADAIPRPTPTAVLVAPKLATKPAETPLGVALARGRVDTPKPDVAPTTEVLPPAEVPPPLPVREPEARPSGPGTVLNWKFGTGHPPAAPAEEPGVDELDEGSAGPFA